MPRVENLGENVSMWCDETGEGSSTHDVCNRCFHELEHDGRAFNDKLIPYNGDPQGVDGWGNDCEHPSYGEYDIDYDCEVCGKKLTARDD